MTPFWAQLRSLWHNPRARIVFWATIVGIVMGLSDLGMPFEEGLRNVRWWAYTRQADQQIIAVLQDDRTLDELGRSDVTRSNDADVLKALFATGAKDVYFVRSFSKPSMPTDDARFLEMLKQHRGKVYLGATLGDSSNRGNFAGALPLKMFREYARPVSLVLRQDRKSVV